MDHGPTSERTSHFVATWTRLTVWLPPHSHKLATTTPAPPGITEIIRVFLFGNTSERNLQVKQAKFILGNIMSYGSISLLTAIPLWFVMYYLLLVISDYLIDINSVLHGIFGYKTFNFALFLNA